VGAFAVFTAFAISSSAAPVVGLEETWGSAGTAGWQVDNMDSVSPAPTVQNGGGFLQLTVPLPTDTSYLPVRSIIYAGAGAPNYIGNYAEAGNDLSLSFRFNAQDAQPNTLALYFQSSSGNEWIYELNSPLPSDGWVNYRVPVNGVLWGILYQPNTSSSFYSDFSTVTRFGLYVITDPSFGGTQNFGLDNFQLVVPEPETVWLMIAAMLSMGVTFRGKLGSLAAQVRNRLTRA